MDIPKDRYKGRLQINIHVVYGIFLSVIAKDFNEVKLLQLE